MIPADVLPVANHIWQSTLFAAAAWLLTVALRKNRPAVRYGIWLAASAKFLVPFSLVVSAVRQTGWRVEPVAAGAAFPAVVEQISQPFSAGVDTAFAVLAETSPHPVSIVLLGVWFCGFAISVTVWVRLWWRFRIQVRAASPLQLGLPIPVMAAPSCLEPGVFGIFRPILLLPEGILERLTAEQFQSIVAHELCHVRRRDNLTGALHMLVEATFWFHPLVWWIGARLVEERERACDEEVVRMGNDPAVYAEGILNVCKFYLRSPLTCAAGVTGADLKKRIESIVANRIAVRLTAARRLLVVAAGVAAIGTPVIIGLWRAPLSRAQSQAGLVFEVASIKLLNSAGQPGGAIPLSPGVTPDGGLRSRVSVFNLICWAYEVDGSQLSGGPSWVRSDRYAIDAKPGPEDGALAVAQRALSQKEREARTRERVKTLLADRFQLTVRSDSKEAGVYVLSVAKGGHKLVANTEGKGGIRYGGDSIESDSAPISFLAVSLTQMMGRPVLDETGVEGRFRYRLEFQPYDDQTRRAIAQSEGQAASDDERPSIFAALKSQLGLELHSKRGKVGTVVIERIERPSAN